MLIRILEHLKPQNLLRYPAKGIVVYNNDPKKLGRIKCHIEGLVESDATSDVDQIAELPWCYPKYGFQLGGKNDSSAFVVPELNSEIFIEFPYNDVYFPFYTSHMKSDATMPANIWDTHYPNVYGWMDSIGQFLRVDKVDPFVEYYRDTQQDFFRIDKNGTWWINVPKSLVINVGEDMSLNITSDVIQKIGGHATFKTEGEFSVSAGDNVNLKSSANITENCASQEIVTSGDQGISAGGSMMHNASVIQHNNGSSLGIASGNDATVTAKISELETKIDSLVSKLAELKQLVS